MRGLFGKRTKNSLCGARNHQSHLSREGMISGSMEQDRIESPFHAFSCE